MTDDEIRAKLTGWSWDNVIVGDDWVAARSFDDSPITVWCRKALEDNLLGRSMSADHCRHHSPCRLSEEM